MADHHDDKLDSALDLLRSRQWAGPMTNPVLEKQFMQTVNTSGPLRLKLVWCVAGALIGCGAVAAATRPAWRTAVFGRPTEVAARIPVPVQPATTPQAVEAVAQPKPSVQPAIAAAPAPVAVPPSVPATPPPVAPEMTLAEMGDLSPPFVVEESGVWASDPACSYEDAMAAWLDSYMAGDRESCDAIARMMDEPADVHARILADLSRTLIATVHLKLALEGIQTSGSPLFRFMVDDAPPDAEGEWIFGDQGVHFTTSGEGDQTFEWSTFNGTIESPGQPMKMRILRVMPSIQPAPKQP